MAGRTRTGLERDLPPAARAGAGAVNNGSIRTVPVNQSAGPLLDADANHRRAHASSRFSPRKYCPPTVKLPCFVMMIGSEPRSDVDVAHADASTAAAGRKKRAPDALYPR